MRPGCDQESTSWAASERPDAGLVEQLRGELAGELSRSRVRARAPRLSVACTRRAIEREGEQACRGVRGRVGVPGRVAARRLSSRARVSGRSSLRSGSGVVTSRSRSWQSPARFALTAPSRAAISARNASRSPPLRGVAGRSLVEHAARGPDRVERIGLTARAALPAQPADLEHLLATAGQEAGQAGPERAAALDRERAPPRRMPLGELQRLPVAVAVAATVASNTTDPRPHLDDRERVRVAMRVDTDDVVQLICKHP